MAAPGCNATAVTLALAPLIHAGLVASTDIQAVLAVGPSGAGRVMRSDLLGAELMSSANPYAVGGVHRHIPEIAQNLKRAGASEVSLSLTPVLVPMSRGILATCTALRTGLATVDEIYQALTDVYAHEPYLQVLDPGLLPRTKDVLGSNTVSLGVAIDEAVNRVIVVAAVDNLVKGTAGAAIQSLNLVCGFPETTGLSQNGVAP